MDETLTRPVGVRLDRLRGTPAGSARLLEGRDGAGHDDDHLAPLGRTLDGRP
jgi:hypothetical protein